MSAISESFTPWRDLLSSMDRRRSYDARFYKPVCLIAVIDGVLDGTIDPEAIDPAAVMSRFRSYVRELQPGRAELGWRPFWHLANDGAWVFSKNGRTVRPGDFGRARKPDSRGQLLSRIDAVSAPPTMIAYWKSRSDLGQLRQASLAILDNDDQTCRSMAALLRGKVALDGGNHPGFEKRESVVGQGFQGSVEAKTAVEGRAMVVAEEMLGREGWGAEDVSRNNCFDFLCRRKGQQVYVEVKGSTGNGDRIILTRAEVEFAQKNRNSMMLIVVSDIQVSQVTEGGVVASGRTATVYRAWSPDERSLQPVSYTCVLREEDAGAQD